MATTLELIDHTFIDRQSRQTIRSHVMKGKNVGKVRLHKRRPSHSAGINKGAQVTSITPLSRRDEQREEMEKRRKKFEEQVKICPKLLARMGNELSGLSSACEMSSQSRKYVHDFLLFAGEAAYPSEFCKNMPDPNLTLWFQYMLVDEACKWQPTHVPLSSCATHHEVVANLDLNRLPLFRRPIRGVHRFCKQQGGLLSRVSPTHR
jgi:hypothetical protein